MGLQDIIKALNDRIEIDGADKRAKEHFYFSEGLKCSREIYYHLLYRYAESTNSKESVMRMMMGKKIEEGYLQKWKDAGLLEFDQFRIEIPVYIGREREFWLNGYTDFILKDPETLRRVVCETKTFYGPYAKKDYRVGIAKDNHIIQLGLYIYFILEHNLLRDVENWGFIHYISRDDMEEFFIKVEVDGDFILCGDKRFDVKEILQRYVDIAKCIIKGEVPEPDYSYKYSPEEIEDLVRREKWDKIKISTLIRNDFMDKELDKNGKPIKLGRLYSYVPKKSPTVLGDWQCKYCAFKERCVKDLGGQVGYTEEELDLTIDKLNKLKDSI